MRSRAKQITRSAMVLAALLLPLAIASADHHASKQKRITFTTKSQEAIDSVAKIVRAIESQQPPQQWIAFARKAVELDPQFAFGHYLLATGLLPQPESRQHADKAVELAKNASEGERRYIEAVLLARAQQPDKAAAIFEELAKQHPEERMVFMMLGQVYTSKGSLDQAKSAFERAIQLDGSTPRAHTFLGNIELLRGDYAKARKTFHAAADRAVSGTAPFGARTGIAYTFIYEGNIPSALKAMHVLLEEYEKSPGAANQPPVFIWNSIGRLLLETGRAEESIKAYEKGYATVPSSSLSETDKKVWLGRLHHGRGRALAKMGKHAEAWKEAELIKKMIDEGGEQGQQFMPSYHYIAGYLKLESGDYSKAIEHLKQADQNDPFNKLLLARAYDKAGDSANAQKTYREIIGSTQVTIERALAYPEAKRKLKS
jgi:tetratricopeptide (TPR) repeat protein